MSGHSRTTPGLVAVTALLFGLFAGLAAAAPKEPDNVKDLLSAKEIALAVNHSIKQLQDASKNPGGFPQRAQSAEVEGYILIALAQAMTANGDLRGPVLRDAAMSLTETVGDYRKAAAARNAQKQQELYDAVKAEVSHLAKWETFKPVEADNTPLEKVLTLKQLMEAVKQTDGELVKATKLPPGAWRNKQTQEDVLAQTIKMQALTIGMVAHTPEKDPDAKNGQTVKLWHESSLQVREGVKELIKTVNVADPRGFKDTYNGPGTRGCGNCHDKYRIGN